MPLLTTTIGSYPKPDYVPIPDWFQEESTVARDPAEALDDCEDCRDPAVEEVLDRATCEVVLEQVRLGIDIPTDGEVRRENYIHYLCRQMEGIDFFILTRKAMRNGQWVVSVPTIAGPVKAGSWRMPAAGGSRSMSRYSPVNLTRRWPLASKAWSAAFTVYRPG